MSIILMAIKILLMTLMSVAASSASRCCRGYKILQFRRPGILPMYEGPPSCGSMYNHQDDFCGSSLYHDDSLSKYDGRYYSSYPEPKTITHKCICSKSIASQRMVTTVPRLYKRGYCSEPMVDGPCRHYGCGGQYDDCTDYAPCSQCGQYSPCAQTCTMSSQLFRQPPHRVLPLTLPASCVC